MIELFFHFKGHQAKRDRQFAYTEPCGKDCSAPKRRPFTLLEIKRVLKACGDDTEWRGLVLFGLYIGPAARRFGKADLARCQFRDWRDRFHCAQNRSANCAAAGAATQ